MAIKSNRGGKRPGSGRKKGTTNKLTFELKKIAAKHGEEALNKLMEIIRDNETPANVTVMACKEILDRGFGKSPVTLDATEINIKMIPWDELRDISKAALEHAEKEHSRIIEGRAERLGIKVDYDGGVD